jgi:glycosyltransferase involved in cell wall biosynthesis
VSLVAFDAVCLTQDRAGTARHARSLLAALRAAGAELVELGGGGHERRGSLRQKARALEQDIGWYAGGGLVRAARRAAARVLYCPTFRGPLRPQQPPVCLTVHDLAVLREPRWFPLWSRRYGAYAVPRAVRAAARVVCVSQATAADVAERLDLPSERLRVVPNGIDAVFSEPPGPRPLPEPYLLFVGTPEPRKNLERLLAAHALLRARGHEERLVLVGGGGWGGEPGRAAAAAGGVLRLGRVDDARLRDLYAHAAATVYPSLWEGFGLVAGEALAAGCPLACSDLPALRELAGADAVYFDPGSSEDVARGIADALARPRPAPRRPLTWEAAADALLAVWRELA